MTTGVDVKKIDNRGLAALRGQVIEELKRRVRQVEGDLELLRTLIGEEEAAMNAPRRGRRGGGRRGGAKRAAKAGGGRRRKRGESWGVIEAALKKHGGSGKTTDLKAAWKAFGSKTPLGVNLAGHVKAKRLKKKGSGRGAVYSLAEG